MTPSHTREATSAWEHQPLHEGIVQTGELGNQALNGTA